jgi:hypothetical protein
VPKPPTYDKNSSGALTRAGGDVESKFEERPEGASALPTGGAAEKVLNVRKMGDTPMVGMTRTLSV